MAMFSVALFTFLLHSLLLCLPVYPMPLDARQADNPPQTLTTVNTATSPMGTLVVTCVLVFTPVKDDEGRDVMREVKTCTLVVDSSPSSSRSSSEIISTTRSTIPLSTTVATLLPLSASFPIPSFSPNTRSSGDDTGRSSPTVTSTTATSSSTIPLPETLTSSTSVHSTAGVSGIGAVSDSSMPGKTLTVLPVGLGVFAGISVIALIVVGLVTYERTKYRKAFRERQQQNKLADVGAPMGYGGMNY